MLRVTVRVYARESQSCGTTRPHTVPSAMHALHVCAQRGQHKGAYSSQHQILISALLPQVEMTEMQMMLEEQVKNENFFDAEKTKAAINSIMTRRAELAI